MVDSLSCLTCHARAKRRGCCCWTCHGRHTKAIRAGKASWAELERQGVVTPAEPRGRKWMAGFSLWLKGG
jgi:hypothetical protein